MTPIEVIIINEFIIIAILGGFLIGRIKWN